MKKLQIILLVLFSLTIQQLYSQIDTLKNIDETVPNSLFSPCASRYIDTLKYWCYDIIEAKKNPIDTNLICTIVFFRNTPIDDSVYEKKNGKKFIPEIYFNIYPISDEKRIAKIEFHIRMISNCIFISSNLFKTKNFIFYNKVFCHTCHSSDYNTDYCRGNINKMISYINKKHYNTFDDLLLDLPIKRMKYK